MTNNGFINETQLKESLNGNKYSELNDNLKNLILKVNKNSIPKSIKVKQTGGAKKDDLILILDNKEYTISIKNGKGNSVHQEKLEPFICYLKDNFEDNIKVFNDIRHFIWGDNTLNGNGKIQDRISAIKYKKLYPERISNIQDYFDKYQRELIIRFVLTGVNSNSKIDYIYYGTHEKGILKSSEEVLNVLLNNKSKGTINIGRLNFQAWNRNINGGSASEEKRGVVQLKWSDINSDLSK